jgi:hypothetical protein
MTPYGTRNALAQTLGLRIAAVIVRLALSFAP